jgi:hypothetical protein
VPWSRRATAAPPSSPTALPTTFRSKHRRLIGQADAFADDVERMPRKELVALATALGTKDAAKTKSDDLRALIRATPRPALLVVHQVEGLA